MENSSRPNQTLQPSETKTYINPVSSGQPSRASNKIWWVVMVFEIILILGITIGVGIYLQRSKTQKQLQSSSTTVADNTTKLPNNSTTDTETLSAESPIGVVNLFFKAVKNKDRNLAKTFLSPNANKAAFQSTIDDSYNGPSLLYTQSFTYKVLTSNLDADGKKAYVDLQITIAGNQLDSKFVLEKTGSTWLIVDNENVSQNNSLPFQQVDRSSNSLNRVLLTVDGPAEFYLTSPEKKHTGFDPVSKQYVNEIPDASYNYKSAIRSFAITDLTGTWEIQVIGQNQGKFTIITKIVNSANSQPSGVEGLIAKDEKKKYVLKYPDDINKPLEITLLQ